MTGSGVCSRRNLTSRSRGNVNIMKLTTPSILIVAAVVLVIHLLAAETPPALKANAQSLPTSTAPSPIFRGAPEPQKSVDNTGADRGATQTQGQPAPVSAEEEKVRFTLAPGFEIELIASEDIPAGIGKFVAVDWDQQGNLWTMTALEYPVDANENAAAARELYASNARDKVLVYDRDPKSPSGYESKPRVFAEGLAIPLGILPYKNGVYVQHGPDIVFLSDTDGDGKADKREMILSGFGVQDSHLFPHQFTRGPGNWIWFAQGAFNYGKVRTTKGTEVQFDQTRMARFRYDGSEFDITSQGPCNIWGLFLTMEGETWIQEANDFGYPAMPFHEYANYPGCSQAQWKSYAPEFPATAPHFAMGGTGLSGLAMTDEGGWPDAYGGVLYIANPITRKIQAIQALPEGPRYALNKLPDFIQSSDEMFRPVALRLGPDACLYIVDWYNTIISHNEVPRNHPERDKKRGRIWRVKPEGQNPLDVPDFTRISGDELIAKLGSENTTQSHLAWQAIADRQLKELEPRLKAIVRDGSQKAGRRIAGLWALEELGHKERFGQGTEHWELLRPLLSDPNRNIRREAIRSFGTRLPSLAGASGAWVALFEALEKGADDPDPQVRSEIIKTTATTLRVLPFSSDSKTSSLLESRALPILAKLARPSLDGPTMKSTQSGRTIKAGEAYEREFERYLVRFMLERHSLELDAFLNSAAAMSFPVENRLLLTLALEPKSSAGRVAELLPMLRRAPGQEELLRLAGFPDEPGVNEALKNILQQPVVGVGAMETLLSIRTKLDASKITPLLTQAGQQLLSQETPAARKLGARLAGSFQLAALEPELARVVQQGWTEPPNVEPKGIRLTSESLAALQALSDLKSDRVNLFAQLARNGGLAEQQAAVVALAASRDADGPRQLANLFPSLSVGPRRSALAGLTRTKHGATALVKSVRSEIIPRNDLDGATIDRLHALLGEDPDLSALIQEMDSFFRPALRLNGEDNAWVESNLKLEGPFTVETWVKLDPGIDNNDGILGAPGILDLNFFGAQFRVWVGGGIHDAIVAKKKTAPDVWTHLAVTRDERGNLRIYQNGELDTDQGNPVIGPFDHLRVGWTGPSQGTGGWLSEYRIWNQERSPEEIRADFDRSFDGHPRPSGLVWYSPGRGPWGKLQAGASIMKTSDYPPLLTAAESKALASKFARFQAVAAQTGDVTRGSAVFTMVCRTCHSVGGQGGQIGPVLNGAGALGTEALLRNLLTPNAAMEPGYRVFRVELLNGDILDGIRVSEDEEAIVLRRPNAEDLRIAQREVRKASFTKTSMMPEELIEALPEDDVRDLFAFLKTLK